MTLQVDLQKAEEILRDVKLAHFNIPNWSRPLLPVARKAGAKIAVDIQDVVDVHDPYRQDFIENADFLFFSAVNHPNPAVVMNEFLKANPNLIMICGMGEKGCALGGRSGIEYFPAFQMHEPVVSTNGAGDALAVGFLNAFVLENHTLSESIRYGQIAARYTCTLRGTSNHLIDRVRLENLYHE
jgi:sugar/nucleoside kinase (ribokinase family)